MYTTQVLPYRRTQQAPARHFLPASQASVQYVVRSITGWLHVGRGKVKQSQLCCHLTAMAVCTSFSAKRISNAFLTNQNPSERIWLIVLNYLVPPETRSLWGNGVLPASTLYQYALTGIGQPTESSEVLLGLVTCDAFAGTFLRCSFSLDCTAP